MNEAIVKVTDLRPGDVIVWSDSKERVTKVEQLDPDSWRVVGKRTIQGEPISWLVPSRQTFRILAKLR